MFSESSPLNGLMWNEAEYSIDFYRGMLIIIAYGPDGQPIPVGSGFVIKSDGRRAWAMTAAHVLSEIRRIQAGVPRHVSSALEMFLPRPKAVDIDRKRISVAYRDGDNVNVCVVTGLAFDEHSDIGILVLATQDSEQPSFPVHEFAPDDQIPKIGSIVCVLSIGDLGAQDFFKEGQYQEFKISLRPVLRIGKVTAYHPEGTRLCKGPCIETSIPVFSGMSGGPVFLWNGDSGAIKPFALVCSDPDIDGEEKFDRSKSGASIMAILPTEVHPLPNGAQYTAIRLQTNDFAGEMDPAQIPASYRPKGERYLSRYAMSWTFTLPKTS